MNPIFSLEIAGRSIPDTVFVSAGLTLLLAALAWAGARRMRASAISRWQTAVEVFVAWLGDTLGEIFDRNPDRYAPLIGGLIVFIAASNLVSLIPVIRPPTADLSTTVALALVVFLAVPYFGVRELGWRAYFKKYTKPHPLLTPLNIMGEVTRTIALAIRLFGNAMSGQMIGAILLVVAGALVPIPLLALGILTGLVQAYIFGILAAVYIAAAVEVDERAEGERHG